MVYWNLPNLSRRCGFGTGISQLTCTCTHHTHTQVPMWDHKPVTCTNGSWSCRSVGKPLFTCWDSGPWQPITPMAAHHSYHLKLPLFDIFTSLLFATTPAGSCFHSQAHFLLCHLVSPSLICGWLSLAMSKVVVVAWFGLNRTAETLSATGHLSSSPHLFSLRLPCSCHLSSLSKKKHTCCPCLQLPTRQQRPQHMSFHSLASLLKGNTMCSTSICEPATILAPLQLLQPVADPPHLTESKGRRLLLHGARNSAFPSLAQSWHWQLT